MSTTTELVEGPAEKLLGMTSPDISSANLLK